MTVLALGLEAISEVQDLRFLLLHLLGAHGEFRKHYGNTGDGLGLGCPQWSHSCLVGLDID